MYAFNTVGIHFFLEQLYDTNNLGIDHICRSGREPIFLIILVLDCILCIKSYQTDSTLHFKKTSPNAVWDFEYLRLLL